MKYLIVGLGNVGFEYENTRHNIGFDVLDAMAKEFDVSFKLEHWAHICEFKHKSKTFVLIKPTTYVNLSGKAVRFWLQKYGIPQENLLVVLDDLNLPFGKQKLKGNGSPGGHNGLKSIDLLLGNNNYARLRLGIGDDFSKGRQVDFVLGKWTDVEGEDLPGLLKYAADTALGFGTIGLAMAMNLFNKK
jgi:peptidyl-tRNA hydrolase, PTH1 family